MKAIKKRSRMVNIRLSEDELRKLHEICESTGARSISALVRAAMHKLMGDVEFDEAAGEGMYERLHTLDERVTRLQLELTRVSLLVAAGMADKVR